MRDSRGIGRFVDGKFGLDRLTAATAAEPQARQAIRTERVERERAARDAERGRVDDALGKQ